mmetsp:Transcript_45757/g.73583  ORF Transcript_45757/g.73583 Transcript_45757/m.73583 type:complete len:177 (+) Transcript_45757:450-980(+)
MLTTSVCNQVRYIVEKHKGHKIYLVASSAGAPIAGTVLNRVDEIEGYIGIGYIFGFAAAFLFGGHYPGVLCSNKRRLFINGSCDMFTSVCEYLCCWCMMCGPRKTHTIPGVGHFEMEGPSYDSYMVDLIDKFVSDEDIPTGAYGCMWCLPTSCCSTCLLGVFTAIIIGILASLNYL